MDRNLSVIIPSRNVTNLAPCVAAVRRHEPSARIVVIDDGLEYHPNDHIHAIDGIKPFIYARNVNLGIREAENDDCVLLNDDALLQSPGGFSLMQRAAKEHTEYGVIGATCNWVGNPNQHPKGVGLRDEPRMVCFVAVLIPRRTIDLVGLLDEEFAGYGFEDDSYCVRVRRAGLKIGIHDGCFVDHKTLKSSFRGDRYPIDGFRQNRRIFEQKYGMVNA
jgi:GT2 family glycosyltransferase